MFTSQAQSAILDLQRRATKRHDIYDLECIDRALDEIVRNPLNTSPAPFQVRSALANASKIIKNRRVLAPTCSLDRPGSDATGTEEGYLEVEMNCWIDAAPLPDRDRVMLRHLAAGTDVTTLADNSRIPVQRMRETVSRTRGRTKASYAAAVMA